ncbi:MAG: hypothetical protein IJT94_13975, partial [Oscillibacter sp.]|nr:hypothetical protein [Oscillibacter sp.]
MRRKNMMNAVKGFINRQGRWKLAVLPAAVVVAAPWRFRIRRTAPPKRRGCVYIALWKRPAGRAVSP